MSRAKRPALDAAPSERRLRCAVYTRKSSDEGLEQSFNSLHAQREACESYVRSQAGEGWRLLPTLYDDGGFSGGDMARPALVKLMADVDAGRIDVVVVYKVDRLTRALADFAKIVERFDAKAVSFVSVTQAFNTTSSMGRLTLNVLLSFAQFEREVTGERIRDKIALSKAKGMWMGGVVPLGYDAEERSLVVNAPEAQTVRAIYRRYLELGSVHRLRDELQAQGVRSKRWTRSDGQAMGGAPIGRGALFHILQNRLYRGEIVHKQLVHPGRHAAIVDADLFQAVAGRLETNRVQHRARPRASITSPLAGRVFDAQGEPMGPSFAYGRHGRVYRYYISAALQAGGSAEGRDFRKLLRAGAASLEAAIVKQLVRLSGRPELKPADLPALVQRLELRSAETQLVLISDTLFGADHPELALEALQQRLGPGERAVWEPGKTAIRLRLPFSMRVRGGRTRLTDGHGEQLDPSPVQRPSPALLTLLRSAHRVQQRHGASPLTEPGALVDPRAADASYHRNLGRLAFLAPDLQRALIEGRVPPTLTSERLIGGELPLSWADQRVWLGLKSA